jgi:hypothetical protein
MMPDGRRLPVTTEAAGRLGVSVQTIDRLVVASRELAPFNRRWRLVGAVRRARTGGRHA